MRKSIIILFFFSVFLILTVLSPSKAFATTITTGTNPYYVASIGTKVYVSNNGSNTVSVINSATDTVTKNISVDDAPRYIRTVGTKIYVTHYNTSGSVSVIDSTTDTLLTTIPVGDHPFYLANIGTKLYVSNQVGGTVSVIDTTTDTVTATISAGTFPRWMTIVGTKLYVTNTGTNNVSVIETTTDTVVATVAVGSVPNYLSSVGTKVYVSNANNATVSVIDSTTDTVIATVATFGTAADSIAYGTKVYVSDGGFNRVSVIDTTTDTVTATIFTNGGAFFSGVFDNKVYVSDANFSTVSIIDPTTDTFVGTIPTGSNTFYFAFVGSKIYVANNFAGTVTAVDTTTTTDRLPSLTSFTSTTANGQYHIGQSINITANFSQTLHSGSTMTVLLNNGASVVLSTVNGSTLSGTYVIASNSQKTPDLEVSSVTSASVSDNSSHTRTSYHVPLSQGSFIAENSFITRNIGDSKNISIGAYTTIAVGNNPYQISPKVTVSGVDYVYVANQGDGTVSVIRLSDNTVVSTITVGSEPYGLSTATISGVVYVYVANTNGNTVSVINTSNNTVAATVSVGLHPYYVATIGTNIYVTNGLSNTVSVIDGTNNTVTATIPVGNYPRGIKAHGTDLYVANYGDPNYTGGDSISVINSLNNTVTANIPLHIGSSGPRGVTVLGSKVYVANFRSNNVSVIDTANNTIVATVPVGMGPRGIVGLGTHIYVENFDDGTISIIDTSNNTVTATIVSGHSPAGMGVSGTDIYFSRFQDNEVSILNTNTNTLYTPPPTAPDVPSNLATSVRNQGVHLTWDTPYDGGADITDYLIEYDVSSDNFGTPSTFAHGDATTSETVTGLSNGVSYDFRVSAINSVGTGSASSVVTGTPSTITPDAPTNLVAIANNTSVSLTWDAPASDGGSAITDYLIEYDVSSDNFATPSTFTHGNTTTSETITGLTNNISYDFRVSAINSVGTGSASSVATAMPTGAPDAPTNLVATSGNTSAHLTWDAPASDGGAAITDYFIEYDLTSDNFATPSTFAHGDATTSETVTGLSNGVSYDFRVSAINSVGTGSPSNVATATPTVVPDAPTNLVATSGNTTVDLTWDAPNDNGSAITDYLIEYDVSSDNFATPSTFTHGNTTTSETITGLTNNISYDFRVSAINSVGTGSASSVASATPATTPDVPTNLSAAPGNTTIFLVWNVPNDNGSAITDYLIEYDVSSDNFATPSTFTHGNTTTSETITGLTNNISYDFRVSAINSVGTGSASSVASATPLAVPFPPTNLVATPSDSNVQLTWDIPNDGGSAITDYLIEYDVSSDNFASPNVFPHGNTTTSETVTGLSNGTSYDFRVSAINSIGTGNPSDTITSTPIAATIAPDAPTNLVAIANNTSVSLTWDAPASDGGSAITDYLIEYDVSSDNFATPSTFTHGNTTTSETITGLTNNISYDFRVSAINSVGTGSASSVATAMPTGASDAIISAGTLATYSLFGDFSGGADIASSSDLTVTVPDAQKTDAQLFLTKDDANSTINYFNGSQPSDDTGYTQTYSNNVAITVADGDTIWLLSITEDGTTKLYYKITVTVMVTMTITTKIDFTGTTGDFQGQYADIALTLGSNGKFYGMACSGGANNQGVIFEWDPNTNTYVDKIDFTNITGDFPGSCPFGGHLTLGSNGKFYGMTEVGGASNSGVIFEWDPNTNTYIDKIDFTGNNGDFLGSYPDSYLTLNNNGKFYGTACSGGANGAGVIFEWDPNTNIYTAKVELTGIDGDFPGNCPANFLTLGSNDKYYGLTDGGGANGFGVIFEWDPNTNTYIDKIDFTGTTGDFPGSSGYDESLTLGSNGKFYGMTERGGANNNGVIFEWDPNVNIYIVKIDFTGTTGSFLGQIPISSLVLGLNGKYYGITYLGGTSNNGIIFEWDPNTNIFVTKFEFDGASTGGRPFAQLVLGSNGKFYGLTDSGGANSYGIIFEWDPQFVLASTPTPTPPTTTSSSSGSTSHPTLPPSVLPTAPLGCTATTSFSPLTGQSCGVALPPTFLPVLPNTAPITALIIRSIVSDGNISLGKSSPAVRSLQSLLNSLGFTVSTTGAGSVGQESTFFGPKTKAALMKFQKANGLKPDGILGPKTKAAIAKYVH